MISDRVHTQFAQFCLTWPLASWVEPGPAADRGPGRAAVRADRDPPGRIDRQVTRIKDNVMSGAIGGHCCPRRQGPRRQAGMLAATPAGPYGAGFASPGSGVNPDSAQFLAAQRACWVYAPRS